MKAYDTSFLFKKCEKKLKKQKNEKNAFKNAKKYKNCINIKMQKKETIIKCIISIKMSTKIYLFNKNRNYSERNYLKKNNYLFNYLN